MYGPSDLQSSFWHSINMCYHNNKADIDERFKKIGPLQTAFLNSGCSALAKMKVPCGGNHFL